MPRGGRAAIGQRLGTLLRPSGTVQFSELPKLLSDMTIAEVPVDDFNAFRLKLMRRIGGGEEVLGVLGDSEVGIVPHAVPLETAMVVHEDMRRKIERLDHQALVSLASKHHGQLVDLRAQHYDCKRQLTRADDKICQLGTEVAAWKEKFDSLQTQVNFRPKKRNVSLIGGYTMVIKRGGTYCSRQQVVSLLAADSVNGGFKSKNVMGRFEMLTWAALRCRSERRHKELEQSLVPQDRGSPDDIRRDDPLSIEVIRLRGDATHRDIIDKLYTSELVTYTISSEEIAKPCADAPWASVTYQVPDMQTVYSGTGEETYKIWNHQMASVGRASLDDRVNQSHLFLHRHTMFGASLDQGADHKGARRRIYNKFRQLLNMTFTIVWCLQHVFSLQVCRHLQAMSGWVWSSVVVRAAATDATLPFVNRAKEFAALLPVRYVSALKILSNTWRSTGVHKKLEAAAQTEFGDIVWKRHFKKKPRG